MHENRLHVTRREFFGRGARGVGTAALAWLLGREAQAANSQAVLPPHYRPKAKHIIYLMQNGAPTHADLFDYKPKLKEMHGKPIPAEFIAGKRFSTMTGNPAGKLVLAPVEPFK